MESHLLNEIKNDPFNNVYKLETKPFQHSLKSTANANVDDTKSCLHKEI